jgi:peptidoglycan/LPS O-acetylase OafA/YrhL
MVVETRSSHEPDRIDQFDGLRACAFLAVFFHHALRAPLLWMGVDQFFVLSGFLITRNLLSLREQATTSSAFRVFYARRLLRIVPPYYVAIVAILLVEGAVSSAGWYFGFASNIHDALHPIHAPPLETMWSIAVEEQFYLVWPWLVLLLPRRWLAPTFAVAIVAAPVCRILFAPLGFNAVYRLTPCRMDLLAAGALLAWMERADASWFSRNTRRFLAVAAVAVAIFAALSLAVPTFRTSLDLPLFDVVGFSLACLFFACVLAYVRGARSRPVLAFLRAPVMRYVGKISYMAYLLHMLCLDLAHRVVSGRLPSAALGLVLTIAGSTLSWYALEQPLLGLRHRFRPDARGAAAASALS